MNKSIIFLDIDGVLNCQAGYEEYLGTGTGPWNHDLIPKYKYGSTRSPFSKKCVALLNELISLTRAKIVIISTWRYGATIEELQGALDERGVVGKVIDMTEVLGTKRGEEIQEWMDRHGIPEKYVIIDDDCSLDIIQYFKDKVCVQPHEPKGFDEACFEKAVDALT